MTIQNFNFFMTTQVRFGVGSRHEIPTLLKEQKLSRVGVVVDHNLLGVPRIQSMLEDIRAAAAVTIVEPCVISEPTYASLEAVRTKFNKSDLQVFIGVGGGSALDMAKAMAVLMLNKEPALHYRGFNKMTEPVLPVIAVPTTAGTGSEVTPNASFIDSDSKVKMGINGEAIRPKWAFLDPELTLSCPLQPSISAAVDSLVHATEAFVAKKTNFLARFFAQKGFRMVFDNLSNLSRNLDQIEYRTSVMLGAFLSGIALMHSGTGPAAALSYPLGVHYGVPHGIGGAIFLPHVVKYNVEHGAFDYGLMLSEKSEANAANAGKFVEDMFALWNDLKVPNDLSSFKPQISKSVMVEGTLRLQAALDQNPVVFGESEINLVLEKLKIN